MNALYIIMQKITQKIFIKSLQNGVLNCEIFIMRIIFCHCQYEKRVEIPVEDLPLGGMK
jgi:hypothetical protein